MTPVRRRRRCPVCRRRVRRLRVHLARKHPDHAPRRTWTVEQVWSYVYGLPVRPEVLDNLTVEIGDQYASQTSAGFGTSSWSATMYLSSKPTASFHNSPQSTIDHEMGHVVGFYCKYWLHRDDGLAPYLQARGLSDDSRLNTSYVWDANEIFADDWKLLFGSDEGFGQRPWHMNGDIPEPDEIDGLEGFMREWAA